MDRLADHCVVAVEAMLAAGFDDSDDVAADEEGAGFQRPGSDLPSVP